MDFVCNDKAKDNISNLQIVIVLALETRKYDGRVKNVFYLIHKHNRQSKPIWDIYNNKYASSCSLKLNELLQCKNQTICLKDERDAQPLWTFERT